MTSPRKRRSPPLDVPFRTDSADPNTGVLCEPPCKKRCQSQVTYDRPGSQPAREYSQTPKEAAVTSTSADAFEISDDRLSPDEFKTLEEQLTAIQNSQSSSTPERGTTSQLDPASYTETDFEMSKLEAGEKLDGSPVIDLTQNHAELQVGQPDPVSHTKTDFEMPKIDTGEESDGSMVIDLTRDDAEIHVGRSDGFIGIIKPGEPGITVKRQGSWNATPTPMRRALNPLSTNTPSPHKWDDRKSSYSGTTPSKPKEIHASLKQSGLAPRGSATPEGAENLKQPCAAVSPTYTPSALKHEDLEPLEQDCKTGRVKFEDEYKKPNRRQRPTDSSPKLTSSSSFDMAKFLINEQNLAAMPYAAQPSQLKTKLLKHQRQALQWMIDMEQPHSHPGPPYRAAQFWGPKPWVNTDTDAAALPNEPVVPFSGGILADDMGLGKTLEMIALILTDPESGPTLIVAPKGVLTNWESQIRRHILWNHAPRLLRYHGARGSATPSELARNDIVITTYNKVADEAYSEGSLRRVQWRRVILDEGHTIRNPDSMAARAACLLRTKSRWVCTGTPIINSVNDIFSLGRFVGATASLRKSPSDIIRHLKNDQEFLQNFMTTICLRRTKEMSFVNLELPPKEEKLIRIEFSEAEDAMYKNLHVDAKKAAEMFFKSRHYELWNHLLERLLRLRQMCNHWSLCKKKGMNNYQKELHGLVRRPGGYADNSELAELLDLSLEAKIACGVCNEPVELECCPVIIPCTHVFCKACLSNPFQDTLTCPVCKGSFSVADITEMDSVPSSAYEVPSQFDHSSKTETLISLVKKRLQNKGSKIVIFSQWTSFLDIVAHQLGEEDIEHARIDGTMSTGLRDEAVRALQGDPNVRVMLASLRAAGVGISLIAADTAILTDSWWAPAIEEQAVDRVHRLGQTRPTKVYRLVIKNSVEENVIGIQDRKRELVGTAFQEEFKSLSDVSFSGMVREVLG